MRPTTPCLVLAAATLALAAGATQAAGLDIHAAADGKEVGLPMYPGAVKNSDSSSDSAGFSFGVWGDAFGFKLAVVSYRSPDSPDAVAAFYRTAMSQYGAVLDCTGVHGKKKEHHGEDKDDGDKPVTCDSDGVEAGGHVFKVGINRAQRVFKVTPTPKGSKFDLVRVELRGEN